MKGDACFRCRHQTNHRIDFIEDANGHKVPNGHAYDCALGIDNTNLNGGLEVAMTCPSCEPMKGFQMGGYYTHMWFEDDEGCLTWVIQGDGDFPTELGDEEKQMRIHICDFGQVEEFVEFWVKEFEKRKWNGYE